MCFTLDIIFALLYTWYDFILHLTWFRSSYLGNFNKDKSPLTDFFIVIHKIHFLHWFYYRIQSYDKKEINLNDVALLALQFPVKQTREEVPYLINHNKNQFNLSSSIFGHFAPLTFPLIVASVKLQLHVSWSSYRGPVFGYEVHCVFACSRWVRKKKFKKITPVVYSVVLYKTVCGCELVFLTTLCTCEFCLYFSTRCVYKWWFSSRLCLSLLVQQR
jgi:hypothetical protein